MNPAPRSGAGPILVTGADGFIGRRVCALLDAQGVPRLDLVGQVQDMAGLATPARAVVHLAAISRPSCFTDTPEAWETNVAGTLAALNYCQKHGAGLILASTSGVYRLTRTPRPLAEDAPLAPASDYAVSKWLAESLCLRQARDMGLACMILRVFNPYGPDQDPAFAVPGVVRSLLTGQPVSVRTPQAVRDFVEVGDAARAFVAAVDHLRPGQCPVVNIGSGAGVSIMELVRLAEGIFGPATAMHMGDVPPGAGGCAVADIARAGELLDWRPSLSLADGLARFPRDPAQETGAAKA
jgi:nucleoside-diphosphate-sugar epimerase